MGGKRQLCSRGNAATRRLTVQHAESLTAFLILMASYCCDFAGTYTSILELFDKCFPCGVVHEKYISGIAVNSLLLAIPNSCL